ncbi:MAG: hypothetical protein PHQ35_08590 [Phycisphaerae bacterium]|nr:hypothetical protein [Phycisphaerae bacterium]MDD5381547.1 hypothetical protein [Phycisphaerae bacterium]
MNEEKLIEILKNIGQTEVPTDITGIAEQTSQRFASALNILQAQRPERTRFVIGLRLLAAAAVVIFAFAIGLSVGRRSALPQTQTASLNLPGYASPMPAHPTVQQAKGSFWRQKALAAMQPRPYAQSRFDKMSLLNAYKQYLKGEIL